MANYVGGDIIEITCSHPEAGDFRFSPKANESFTFDTGGIRNDDDSGNITGSGEQILKKNRKLWSLEGPVAIDFKSDYEGDSLRKLHESSEPGIWTITHITGVIWKGKGHPVGDISIDTNTAQATMKVAGSGYLEKIS